VAQQRDGSQQGNHYFTMPMKINFIGKALWIDVVAYMHPTLFDRYMLVNNTLMINGVFLCISSSVLSGGGTNLATGA